MSEVTLIFGNSMTSRLEKAIDLFQMSDEVVYLKTGEEIDDKTMTRMLLNECEQGFMCRFHKGFVFKNAEMFCEQYDHCIIDSVDDQICRCMSGPEVCSELFAAESEECISKLKNDISEFFDDIRALDCSIIIFSKTVPDRSVFMDKRAKNMVQAIRSVNDFIAQNADHVIYTDAESQKEGNGGFELS